MAGPQPTEEKDTCRLLSLPAEMKNIIYRFALLEEDDVAISATNKPSEPGLLRTCREIRNDATQIYYQENEFTFLIDDLDASIFLRWCASSQAHFDATSYSLLGSTNSGSWGNLVPWLKAHYHQEAPAFGAIEDDDPVSAGVAHVFRAVHKMRHKDGGGDWDDTLEVLEHVRCALEVSGAEWI